MLRQFSRKAALLLLPVLVQALVLPNDISTVQSSTDASRSTFEDTTRSGPSTFLDYDFDDHSLKFAIPCPECSDEEKEVLKHQIISVKSTAESTKHCTPTDPIGLEINGKRVISTEDADSALQYHIGTSDIVDFSKHPIFNQTRWINTCGCIRTGIDDEGCEGDFESTFSLEFLGLPSGQQPGFTLSYKQHGKPQLLRLSPFADTLITDSWHYGQSAHFKSPRIRLQKAVKPTSTSILSFPSNSPSSTTSAFSPSHTHFEKNPSKSEIFIQTAPAVVIPASFSLQTPVAIIESTRDDAVVAEKKHSGWSLLASKALAAISNGAESVKMTSKSGTQSVLGILDKLDEVVHLKQGIAPYRVSSNKAWTTTDEEFNQHDELELDLSSYRTTAADTITAPIDNDDADYDDNDDGIKDQREGTFFHLDQSKSLWFLEDPTAVKAFQVSSLIVIIVALSGSIFALIRRNPRYRAKWATLLEEKRNQRLYRNAARKQRFLNFFTRNKTCPCEKNSFPDAERDVALDWQGWEKRHSIDDTLVDHKKEADLLSKDLLAFRKAHQFVEGIISAEDARAGPIEYHQGRRFRRHHRARAASFSSEKTAPPAYESENEDIVLDADAPRFVYMRGGAAHYTPDSSVISTSPRTSCADSDSEHDEKF